MGRTKFDVFERKRGGEKDRRGGPNEGEEIDRQTACSYTKHRLGPGPLCTRKGRRTMNDEADRGVQETIDSIPNEVSAQCHLSA